MPVTITVSSSAGIKRYTISNPSLGNETYTMLRLKAYMACLEAGYWGKADSNDPAISEDLMRMVETASNTIEASNATAVESQQIATRLQFENARLQREIAELRADNARLRTSARPSVLPAFSIPVAARPVSPTGAVGIDQGISDMLDRSGVASPTQPPARIDNPYANGGRGGNIPTLEID